MLLFSSHLRSCPDRFRWALKTRLLGAQRNTLSITGVCIMRSTNRLHHHLLLFLLLLLTSTTTTTTTYLPTYLLVIVHLFMEPNSNSLAARLRSLVIIIIILSLLWQLTKRRWKMVRVHWLYRINVYVDRGWNTLIPCMYEATKSQCGQEVANIVVTGYEKLFAAILPNCTVGLYKCVRKKYNNFDKRRPVSITFFSLLSSERICGRSWN